VKAQSDLKSKGLSRRDIDHALPRILNTMSRNQDGTYTLGSFSSEKDESIFDYLVSAFIPRSAFDGDKLFEDFCVVLKSRSLIKREEMDTLKTLRNAITLHVAAIMHNSVIIVNKHVSITLRVSLSKDEGVTVMAAAPTREPPKKVTFWASPMYVVTGRLEELCSNALLAAGKLDAAELEIGPDNKLTII
jgi:hypothetical protein